MMGDPEGGTLHVNTTDAYTGAACGESGTLGGKDLGRVEFWSPTAILNLGPEGISYALRFRVATRPSAGGTPIRFGLASLAEGLIPEVAMGGDGKLHIVTGPASGGQYGTVWWTGDEAPATGTWYVLHGQQYKAGPSGASSNWPIRVKLYNADGSSLLDDSDWQQPIYTGAAANLVNSLTFGQMHADTAGLLQFDDVIAVYGGAGAPAGARVMGIFPAGNSATHDTWTGTANKWDDVDEAPHDSDTTYIESPAAGSNQYQLFTHPAMSAIDAGVSGGTPVYGVEQHAVWKRTAGFPLASLSLKNAAGAVSDSATHVPPTGYDFDSRRMMPVEPSGEAEWTVAKIDGCEFGFRDATATPVLRVTQTLLEVAYGGTPWEDDYEPRIGWNETAKGPGRPAVMV
jgi:hypothetical protein